MKRTGLLFALAAGISLNAVAGGSIYSRYGFGDFLFFGGTRSFAMGGAGIGLIGDGFINRLNPAGLARISNTRFSGGLSFTNIASQAPEGNGTYSTFNFQGFSVAIPIAPEEGIVLAFESTPLSQVMYAVRRLDAQQGINSTQDIFGGGGLGRLALSVSYAPTLEIHTGLKLSYNYGRLRQYTKITFSSTDYTSAEIDRSLYLSGYSLTLGTIVADAGKVFGIPQLRNFNLGVVVTTPISLNGERQDIYTAVDTVITGASSSSIPLSIGFGVSHLMNERYLFAGDVTLQDWSTATIEGAAQPTLRSALRLAAGFELLPERGADTYWKRVAYRLGGGYHRTYYKVNGTGIDEVYGTAGVGLPIAPDARLNLGIQAGIRGSVEAGLEKETFVRFSVGISASEKWFMRFDEE